MVTLFSLRALLWAAAYCQRVIRKFKPVFVVVVILLAFPNEAFSAAQPSTTYFVLINFAKCKFICHFD